MNFVLIFGVLLISLVNFQIISYGEELIVLLTLLALYIYVYWNFRKSIKMFFFFHIEFVYVSFLYLIKSNKILIKKIKIISKNCRLIWQKLNFSNTNFLFLTAFNATIKTINILTFFYNYIWIIKNICFNSISLDLNNFGVFLYWENYLQNLTNFLLWKFKLIL